MSPDAAREFDKRGHQTLIFIPQLHLQHMRNKHSNERKNMTPLSGLIYRL